MNPEITKNILILGLCFGIAIWLIVYFRKKLRLKRMKGGIGGRGIAIGINSYAENGKDGNGKNGGKGGNAFASGKNSYAKGGDGGNSY